MSTSKKNLLVEAALDMFSDVDILKLENTMPSRNSKINSRLRNGPMIKEKYKFLKDLKKSTREAKMRIALM